MAEAGSCQSEVRRHQGLKIIRFEWTSDGAGDVSEVGTLNGISGVIIGVKFDPDPTDQPSDLYDVQILNLGGADVLMGVGADAPQARNVTTNYRTPFNSDGHLVSLYAESLTPAISNAGNAKKGIVNLIMTDEESG